MRSINLNAECDCTKEKKGLQKPVNRTCLFLRAPSLLAYAEQHRWACGGMGAVSSQIKLWVGGPIAILSTQARRACQTRSEETYQGWILCFDLSAIGRNYEMKNKLFS